MEEESKRLEQHRFKQISLFSKQKKSQKEYGTEKKQWKERKQQKKLACDKCTFTIQLFHMHQLIELLQPTVTQLQRQQQVAVRRIISVIEL